MASALALVGDTLVKDSPVIAAFMRGVQRQDGTPVRYTCTWDVQKVFALFRGWPANEDLSVDRLTAKTITLLAMAIIGRASDVARLDARVRFRDRGMMLTNWSRQKNQRTYVKLDMPVKQNSQSPHLCAVEATRCYLKRTAIWRHVEGLGDARGMPGADLKQPNFGLILSLVNGHGPLSAQRIAKRVGEVMALAGVDASFKPGSIRMAVATALVDAGVPVEQVVALGRWSGKQVVRTFYLRAKLRTNFMAVLCKQ